MEPSEPSPPASGPSTRSPEPRRSLRPPRWLPNALTALRIGLIPAFVAHAHWCAAAVAAGEDGGFHRGMALVALAGIGVSDVVDGWVARRYGLETQLGATLDALADKLAQVSLLVFFLLARGPAFAPVPAWLVALVLARDIVLLAGTLVVRRLCGAVEVVHHGHGRASSVLLFAILFWLTADLPRGALPTAFLLAAVLTLVSTAAYVRDGWRQYRATAVDA